jgi:hypothetical protein
MNWRESFTQIYANPYPEGIDDADHPVLRLAYSRTAPSSSGGVTSTPHLGGFSGASVWAVMNNPKKLWAPWDIVKVVAVQVSFKHSAYISAEWWTLVREVFDRWFDEHAGVSSVQ